MEHFRITSPLTPKGDQPQAIQTLYRGIKNHHKGQVLLGVTGSGKTFTMAHLIERVNKPTLVMAPNKTLAAQLYHEFKEIFPENAVEYFVSYYDYYQPEAYIPTTDTYIAKDSAINDMIDKLRHSATRSVLTRNDVIVVASVSCIYGLGAPEDYLKMRVELEAGMELSRDRLLSDLVLIHYERNDMDFHRGVFRVRGDRVEIFPAYEESDAVRVDFFGDTIENITTFDPLTGQNRKEIYRTAIYPASHYVTEKAKQIRAAETIMAELKERIDYFRKENKLIEAQRIEERTMFDMEMIREIGYCNGIENYSRHFTGREKGEPPPTLLEYFPHDFLMIIDESHISVPQIQAMYKGDRSRKQTLVNFGFRLPSALDNRPLKFEEWQKKIHQVIFVSATPAEYEFEFCENRVVEQIVRPTGLIDPSITVQSASHQVDDLLDRIKDRVEKNERILVTTLTKRMAEDLSEYYSDVGIRVKYLHSDIHTLERMDIINDLRRGEFDVLVGINLLREGLDIPEVSLVAIMDADKEGFLRSTRSLVQTFGRAARNKKGEVVLYADTVTQSMKQAIEETERRRKIQILYNKEHNIEPKTIKKRITDTFDGMVEDTKHHRKKGERLREKDRISEHADADAMKKSIDFLEKEMKKAAKNMDFEHAADLRDQIALIKKRMVFDGISES